MKKDLLKIKKRMRITQCYSHFLYLCKLKTEKRFKNMKEIHFKIRREDEFIQLIQLLKAANIVESGALAQILVTQGEVKRNGEVELRKRAKILRGERIETQNFVVITE